MLKRDQLLNTNIPSHLTSFIISGVGTSNTLSLHAGLSIHTIYLNISLTGNHQKDILVLMSKRRQKVMHPLLYEPVEALSVQDLIQDRSLEAKTARTTLALKDVPAFISEPNIDCEENYIQTLEFELSSVQYPQQQIVNYTQSWESVNKKMIDDEDFGALLKVTGFLKDTVEAVCYNKTAEIDKAVSIYNWVQKRM
jgi:hypothetical protein